MTDLASDENTTILPAQWEETTLEDLVVSPQDQIVDGPFGSNLKASEYVSEGVPIVRLQNIERNLFVDKNIKYVTSDKARDLHRHNFQPGDILITKLGDPLGKACEVPLHLGAGVIVADVVRMRLSHSHVNREYLLHAINSNEAHKQFQRKTKGTTRPRVNLNTIRALRVPVPPLNEQRRIVKKIEELFAKLDAGIRSLKQTQALLKSYRRSVLKAAVEGELSREWREAHGDKIEFTSVELRRLTEESLKTAQGESPEAFLINEHDLISLPDTWQLVQISTVIDLVSGYAFKSVDFVGQGIPVIKIANIGHGRFVLGLPHFHGLLTFKPQHLLSF